MIRRVLVFIAGVWLASACGSAWADRPTDHFTPVTKTATATSAQTDTTLWDPEADFRIVLMGCEISAKFAQTVELEVSNADVVPPMFFESYGIKSVGNGYAPIYQGAVDGILTYSTTADGHSPLAAATAIVCWGYETK